MNELQLSKEVNISPYMSGCRLLQVQKKHFIEKFIALSISQFVYFVKLILLFAPKCGNI